jgi:hypothetical protein
MVENISAHNMFPHRGLWVQSGVCGKGEGVQGGRTLFPRVGNAAYTSRCLTPFFGKISMGILYHCLGRDMMNTSIGIPDSLHAGGRIKESISCRGGVEYLLVCPST